MTTTNPALANQMVSSLMETDNLVWDCGLVRDMFNNRDAELILSIPLNASRQQDVWFWSFEKTGQFTVKSTYRHMQEIKEDGHTNGSGFWKKIWKLRIPPKVKDLLWRATTNCLPTKVQLRTKHVNIDARCPSCQIERETISHCLVECSFAKACWDRTGIGVTNAGSFAGWLDDMLDGAGDENRKEIAMTCWAI